MIYPAAPESADSETILQFALDNPMPRELSDQIGNWVEPETMDCELKHRDVMTCIGIAFPLIRAWLAEHPEAAESATRA